MQNTAWSAEVLYYRVKETPKNNNLKELGQTAFCGFFIENFTKFIREEEVNIK